MCHESRTNFFFLLRTESSMITNRCFCWIINLKYCLPNNFIHPPHETVIFCFVCYRGFDFTPTLDGWKSYTGHMAGHFAIDRYGYWNPSSQFWGDILHRFLNFSKDDIKRERSKYIFDLLEKEKYLDRKYQKRHRDRVRRERKMADWTQYAPCVSKKDSDNNSDDDFEWICIDDNKLL